MANVITAMYDFTLPEVGAADDVWGGLLNANWQKMETLLAGAFPNGTPTALGEILKITGGTPRLRFLETDAVAPLGQWEFQCFSTGSFAFVRHNVINFGGGVNYFRAFPDNGSLPDRMSFDVPVTFNTHPITALTGGSRFGDIYLGADPTGTVNANSVSAVSGSNMELRSGVDTASVFAFLGSTGTQHAIIEPVGTAISDAQAIVTKEKGDFRYVGAVGNTGPVKIGSIYIAGDPVGAVNVSTISAEGVALSLRGGVSTGAIVQFRIASPNTVVAQIDPSGTAMLGALSIVTQEKGDNRYVNLSGGGQTIAGANTFTGINKISSSGPALRFEETDATSPAGQFAFVGFGTGDFTFQRYAGAGFTSGVNLWTYDGGANKLLITPVTDFSADINVIGSVFSDASLFSISTIVSGSKSVSSSEAVNKTQIGSGFVTIRRTGTTNQTFQSIVNNQAVTPATVGSITASGSTTAYNTTSDENLKTFTGLLDAQRAIGILRADPPREFDWKDGSGHAVGWGAQTSYAISPDLASPPPEWVPDEEQYPGVREAPKVGELGYQPWGMDLSKRVPYLAAALLDALDRIDALETQLKGV